MKKKWQYKAVFYSIIGLILVVLFAFLFGCNQSHHATDPGPYVSERHPLPDRDTLWIINGKYLTKDFDSTFTIRPNNELVQH